MELNDFFKSIIEQEEKAVVVCDLNHIIIYMNPFAREAYKKRGMNLEGQNLLDCHNSDSQDKIIKVVDWFLKDENNNIIHTFYNEKQSKDVYMVALRDGNKKLIGYYEKHEYRVKDERPFYEFK